MPMSVPHSNEGQLVLFLAYLSLAWILENQRLPDPKSVSQHPRCYCCYLECSADNTVIYALSINSGECADLHPHLIVMLA